MIRKFLSIFILSSLAIIFWQIHQNRIIHIKIPSYRTYPESIQMSCEDKKNLVYFFYNMLILDSGGYTLFGNKPIYMNGGVKPFTFSDWDHFWMSVSPHNIKIQKSWETWKKYEYLFQNGSFLLKQEINPFSRDHRSMCFLLINKRAFIETVQKHQLDFERVLQKKNVNGELLLSEAKEKPLLKTILRKHDGLIGTLFGFGRNNAWLFEERTRGSPISLTPLWGEDVYDYLNNRPDGLCLEDLSLVLGYPTFLAEPNTTETEDLKEQFLNIRNKILAHYKDRDFLEATFEALLEPR